MRQWMRETSRPVAVSQMIVGCLSPPAAIRLASLLKATVENIRTFPESITITGRLLSWERGRPDRFSERARCPRSQDCCFLASQIQVPHDHFTRSAARRGTRAIGAEGNTPHLSDVPGEGLRDFPRSRVVQLH